MDYIGFDKDSLKRDEQKKAREKNRRDERKKSIKKRVLTVIGLSVPSLIVTFALALVVMVAIGKSQMLRMNTASLNLPEIESVAAEDSGKKQLLITELLISSTKMLPQFFVWVSIAAPLSAPILTAVTGSPTLTSC